MINWLTKLLTKSYNEIPLFWINFNLNKFKQYGIKNSCAIRMHPEFKGDEYLKCELNKIVDYIRNAYDMEKISKI
jgi:hypothetical protein